MLNQKESESQMSFAVFLGGNAEHMYSPNDAPTYREVEANIVRVEMLSNQNPKISECI
jgi:hypothetical protein